MSLYESLTTSEVSRKARAGQKRIGGFNCGPALEVDESTARMQWQ